jgi:hypothetical protein
MVCENHERTMERVANTESMSQQSARVLEIHDGQIEDLFEKYNIQNKEYTKIIESLARMEVNQENYMGTVTELSKSITSFKNEIKSKFASIDMFGQAVNEKFTELNKFDWFRKRINHWHDNLPTYVVLFFVGLVLLIAFTIDVSFRKIVDFFRGLFL